MLPHCLSGVEPTRWLSDPLWCTRKRRDRSQSLSPAAMH
ncbi:hypothetical protein BZL30_1240 [Mycobacterium kansasii]|uniref:Uncharacterized protein n=1 Tax=Mycobacterium kansasii TaxID=1768 RepID=A0A1V3XR53_MYCKA|nr:hypothetical protein BZL30_1240 [Mycobacterium kansasii]